MAKFESNSDRFRKNMKKTSQAVSDTKELRNKSIDTYLAKTNKEKEYVSIDLLDAAPDEWNFFPLLEPEKMLRMKLSIINNGILEPCVLWKKEDGRYMILAGHNRIQASREILQEYEGLDHRFEYDRIPAIVFEANEIDNDKAKEIIIDTNFIQRGKMDPKLRLKIMRERISLIKEQKDEKGKLIEELAKEYGLTKTSLFEEVSLCTKLIDKFLELFFDGKISRKAALKLMSYKPDIQRWIYDSFPDKLKNEYILQLGKHIITKEDISQIFEDDNVPRKKRRVQVMVPEQDMELFNNVKTALFRDPKFKSFCTRYMKEPDFRENIF